MTYGSSAAQSANVMSSVLAALLALTPMVANADVYNVRLTHVGVIYSFSFDTDLPVFVSEGLATHYYTNDDFGYIILYNPVNIQVYGAPPLNFNGRPGDFTGPQLYTGSNANPTILTGTFDLLDLNQRPATLQISAAAPSAPAPEVGVGLLSAVAAGLVLWLTRRRLPRLMVRSA